MLAYQNSGVDLESPIVPITGRQAIRSLAFIAGAIFTIRWVMKR